jgi:hypothetical protein
MLSYYQIICLEKMSKPRTIWVRIAHLQAEISSYYEAVVPTVQPRQSVSVVKSNFLKHAVSSDLFPGLHVAVT